MKRAGVIGWPIRHSRSPLIHGYWLRILGIAGAYDRIAVPPEELADFIARIADGELVGCNVTIPHKEAVIAHVHVADPLQRRIGSINTIYIDAAGRVAGESTDGHGFWAALADQVPAKRLSEIERILVMGAGGASRAVVAMLYSQTAAQVTVAARDIARAGAICDIIGDTRIDPTTWEDIPDRLRSADLIVNTTPLGMSGYPDLNLDLEHARPGAIAYDLVYVPLETTFLRDARRHGLTAVDGVGMLLHQAAPGFEKWFGVRPEVTAELRSIVVRDIESGS